jgi:hypothetical protein
MKRILYIIICQMSFCSSIALAQKDSTYYFSADGHLTANKDSSAFYRVAHYSDDGLNFTFTEYRKDGTFVKASAKGTVEQPQYHGLVTLYFKNGKACEIHEYSYGRPLKTLRYHTNGSLAQTIVYGIVPGLPYERIIYEADSTGKVNILNGNGTRKETAIFKIGELIEQYQWHGSYRNGARDGTWTGTDDHGISFEEDYHLAVLISGKSKTADGKKYKYKRIYLNATVDGDPLNLEKRIKYDMKNQSDTLRLDADRYHILSLSYTINEKGNLQDVCGYDKNDMSLISLELKHHPPKVNPATLRGVPIIAHISKPYTINSYQSLNYVFNVPVYWNGSTLVPVQPAKKIAFR